MEYYSAIKKKWNCVIYREVDGPRDCHTEWSESDVEIQMLHDITYMWNLKKKMIQMNLFTEQKHTNFKNKLNGYQRGNVRRGGINWETGINIYTLLYI